MIEVAFVKLQVADEQTAKFDSLGPQLPLIQVQIILSSWSDQQDTEGIT
jgi:hypothetical protein